MIDVWTETISDDESTQYHIYMRVDEVGSYASKLASSTLTSLAKIAMLRSLCADACDKLELIITDQHASK